MSQYVLVTKTLVFPLKFLKIACLLRFGSFGDLFEKSFFLRGPFSRFGNCSLRLLEKQRNSDLRDVCRTLQPQCRPSLQCGRRRRKRNLPVVRKFRRFGFFRNRRSECNRSYFHDSGIDRKRDPLLLLHCSKRW